MFAGPDLAAPGLASRAEFYAPVARLIDEGRARGEIPAGLAAEGLADAIFTLFT